MHRILGKGRRRRRQFAAPFVMTAAMLPGCAVHSGTGAPPPEKDAVQTTSQGAPAPSAQHRAPAAAQHAPPAAADHGSATADRRPNPAHLNPPNPHHRLPTAAPPGKKGSMVILNPPSPHPSGPGAAPNKGPKLHPPPKGGHILVKADGTCWWQPPAPVCPPKMMCNPPPARRVLCKNGKATMKPAKQHGKSK